MVKGWNEEISYKWKKNLKILPNLICVKANLAEVEVIKGDRVKLEKEIADLQSEAQTR